MKITKHIFLVIMGLSIQSTFLAFETVVDQNNSFKIINSSSDAAQKSIFQRVKQHLTDRFNDWRNGKNDLIKTFTNHAADRTQYTNKVGPIDLNTNSSALDLNLTQDQQIRFKNLSTKSKQEVIDAWNKKYQDISKEVINEYQTEHDKNLHEYNTIYEGQRLKKEINKKNNELIDLNKEIKKTENLFNKATRALEKNDLQVTLKRLNEDRNKIKMDIKQSETSLENDQKLKRNQLNEANNNFKNLHNAKREAFKKSLNKWLNADSTSTESTQSTFDTSSETENTPGPERSLSPEDSFENEEPETMESLDAEVKKLTTEWIHSKNYEEKTQIRAKMQSINQKIKALKEASSFNPTTNEASNSSPTNQDETLEEAVARIRNQQNFSSQPRGIYFR